MKNKAAIITLIVILAVVTVVTACVGYELYYLWWGQRHSVLYEVKSVSVEESAEEEGIYYLTYFVEVKNWPHDFDKHTYRLEGDIGGSYGMSDFEVDCDYFISEPFKKNRFEIHVRYDANSGEFVPVEEMINISCFIAIDEDGNEVESASLYMADNEDARIEWTS